MQTEIRGEIRHVDGGAGRCAIGGPRVVVGLQIVQIVRAGRGAQISDADGLRIDLIQGADHTGAGGGLGLLLHAHDQDRAAREGAQVGVDLGFPRKGVGVASVLSAGHSLACNLHRFSGDVLADGDGRGILKGNQQLADVFRGPCILGHGLIFLLVGIIGVRDKLFQHTHFGLAGVAAQGNVEAGGRGGSASVHFLAVQARADDPSVAVHLRRAVRGGHDAGDAAGKARQNLCSVDFSVAWGDEGPGT